VKHIHHLPLFHRAILLVSASLVSLALFLFPFPRRLVSCPFTGRERERERAERARTLGAIEGRREKEYAPPPLLLPKMREDIILLRTGHKVKYGRHKRRTRPWTSLVLRIGTKRRQRKKKKKEKKVGKRGKKRATEEGEEGGTHGGT